MLMNEARIIGEIVIALGTIVGLLLSVQNLLKPLKGAIEENTKETIVSNMKIHELTSSIAAMQESNKSRDRRIEKHGEEIDNLHHRVDKLETKVDMYHKNDK